MQYTHVIWKALLFAVLWQMTMAVGHTQGLDLLNLQQNMPMRMQDAYAIPEHALSVDLAIDVGVNDRSSDWLQTRTQVEYGIAPGLQGVVGLRSVWSDYDETGNGDIYVEILKQIYETPRDALAAEIKLNFPTGQDYARADTSIPGFNFVVDPRQEEIDFWLGAVYTRVLQKPARTRLHAQVQRGFINSAPRGADPNRWFLSLGADHLIAPDTLLMANLWWEESAKLTATDSMALQVGLRRRQTPRLIWAVSLNLGLGWELADCGGALSAQYGF